MTALKIGSIVSRLTVQCITLVSCLSVSVSSRKVQEVTSSQLLGSLLQCGLNWQLERRKLNFGPLHLSWSSHLIWTPPQLSPHKQTKRKLTSLYHSLSLSVRLSLSVSLSVCLSVWSPGRSSVPSILKLSGSIQPCLPLAYLSTTLHNEERVKKGGKNWLSGGERDRERRREVKGGRGEESKKQEKGRQTG